MRTPGRNFWMTACLGWSVLVTPALAQEGASKYPSRAIHIIVGFAAGGGNDIIAAVGHNDTVWGGDGDDMLQAFAPNGSPMATNKSRAQPTEMAALLLSVWCTQK